MNNFYYLLKNKFIIQFDHYQRFTNIYIENGTNDHRIDAWSREKIPTSKERNTTLPA